jgi:hypothetical protein
MRRPLKAADGITITRIQGYDYDQEENTRIWGELTNINDVGYFPANLTSGAAQQQPPAKTPCEVAKELLANPEVQKELREQFERSNYADISKMHEEGGVIRKWNNGTFDFTRAKGKTIEERIKDGATEDYRDLYIDLKTEMPDIHAIPQLWLSGVIAFYHTHPGKIGQINPYRKSSGNFKFDLTFRSDQPSLDDLAEAKRKGIPGLYAYYYHRDAGWFSNGELKFGAFDENGLCQ